MHCSFICDVDSLSPRGLDVSGKTTNMYFLYLFVFSAFLFCCLFLVLSGLVCYKNVYQQQKSSLKFVPSCVVPPSLQQPSGAAQAVDMLRGALLPWSTSLPLSLLTTTRMMGTLVTKGACKLLLGSVVKWSYFPWILQPFKLIRSLMGILIDSSEVNSLKMFATHFRPLLVCFPSTDHSTFIL